MSSNWIQSTPQLQEGITLMNSVEPAKLRLLLNRLCSSMQRDVTGKASPFTEEEEVKLEKSLDMEMRDVRLVIDSTNLILQQAAYHVIKPDFLKNKLVEGLQMEDERATVVVSVWSSNASSIIESLRKRSVLPHQLSDITWLLNVETSSNTKSRLKEPVAVLELLLQSNENNDNERVTFEMRKPELQTLFQNLEKIQSQLDALK